MTMMHHVEITVTGDCGHVLGTWTDEIAEKYPFHCEECGETPTGKYPWKLTTRVIADGACPAEIDGKRCTVEGAHQWHYGPDEGLGVRRMWLDGDQPAHGVADDVLDDLHAEMDVIAERVAALEENRRDMGILIRTLADLHKAVYPDGLVARRGDKPGVGDTPQEIREEARPVVVAVVGAVADHPEDDKAAARIIGDHIADGPA